MSARHVALLTYGEPPEASFGRQFLYSWRILFGLTRLVAPIPAVVVPLIAFQRASLRAATWRRERYRSPIETITHEQADEVAAALEAQAPGRWRVHVAYEFRRPLLEDLLAALPAEESLAILPMYLADSEFTHQMARVKVRKLVDAGRSVTVVPALDAETLAELSARHIESELARRNVEPGRDWALLLAAHGTLVQPPRPMETGRVATTDVAEGIARRLAPRFGKVVWGWLNHALGGKWTSPPADQAMRALAAEGYKKVVYFPYGFLADNAESQLEGRIVLRCAPGLERAEHLPCLNASPALARALARSVVRNLA
ncbi:MAG: ferrochelatase [Candidatus Eisenbacteria bacterium]